MKVIILAGGKGTRLPVSARDIPKGLVSIGGRPILGHMIDRLHSYGMTDIRLALGFRADAIINFLNERGHACEYAVEPEPLGTGGAVKFAAADLAEPFLVLNGDILVDFDYSAITRAYEPGKALMVSYWKDESRDFGLLDVAGEYVRAFREKPQEPCSGLINAGCTILAPDHIRAVPQRSFMLETEVYPALAAAGLLKTIRHRGFFEDIGTEERLAELRKTLERAHAHQ